MLTGVLTYRTSKFFKGLFCVDRVAFAEDVAENVRGLA